MLSVREACEIVFRYAKPLAARAVLLGPDVLGQTLAEDVAADIDSPPFDKSMMDGYAVRAADGAELKVVGEVRAGDMWDREMVAGEAVRIFTGAAIPSGADAVVKQEDTTADGGTVRLAKGVRRGANVMRRGDEMRTGAVVVPAGTVITPAVFGILATVGKVVGATVARPRVKVFATGNELVKPTERPIGGQIRNSNSTLLRAMAHESGAAAWDCGIVRDDSERMASALLDALAETDVLVLSGGVSVGKYDLVPDVLKSLGVQIHFHKVNMKPGKPLLFGTLGEKLVFGLPGNPVSALLGFELFVGPAIRILGGHADPGPREVKLPLSEPLTANHDRPTYHPAVVGDGSVKPLPWKGSADLRSLLPANGYVLLPPGEVRFAAGDVVDVIRTGGVG